MKVIKISPAPTITRPQRNCDGSAHGQSRLVSSGQARIAVGKRVVVSRDDQLRLGQRGAYLLRNILKIARVECDDDAIVSRHVN